MGTSAAMLSSGLPGLLEYGAGIDQIRAVQASASAYQGVKGTEQKPVTVYGSDYPTVTNSGRSLYSP